MRYFFYSIYSQSILLFSLLFIDRSLLFIKIRIFFINSNEANSDDIHQF